MLKAWADEIGISIEPERNLEQTRGGGYDLNGVPGLGIEVKRVEKQDVKAWWRQCLRQAKADNVHPVLMHRRNRQPWRFRTVAKVTVGTYALDLMVDMEAGEFETWFKYYLWDLENAA